MEWFLLQFLDTVSTTFNTTLIYIQKHKTINTGSVKAALSTAWFLYVFQIEGFIYIYMLFTYCIFVVFAFSLYKFLLLLTWFMLWLLLSVI